jgi:hypothetical protein
MDIGFHQHDKVNKRLRIKILLESIFNRNRALYQFEYQDSVYSGSMSSKSFTQSRFLSPRHNGCHRTDSMPDSGLEKRLVCLPQNRHRTISVGGSFDTKLAFYSGLIHNPSYIFDNGFPKRVLSEKKHQKTTNSFVTAFPRSSKLRLLDRHHVDRQGSRFAEQSGRTALTATFHAVDLH